MKTGLTPAQLEESKTPQLLALEDSPLYWEDRVFFVSPMVFFLKSQISLYAKRRFTAREQAI